MSINEIIILIMVVFAVLGAMDKIIGNRFGLGKKFEEGLMAIAPLTISMVGIIVLAPVIANILKPFVIPLFGLLGADPAMLAGSILANDMGGAALAQELALNQDAGNFAGLIVSSMLGVTVVFTIPVSLRVVNKEDRMELATGVLAGIITVPIGSFAGGMAAGYPLRMVLLNLTPVILFAAIIAFGLWKFQKGVMKAFILFGQFMEVVITLGLVVGIVEALLGITMISGTTPISEGFEIVAEIAIVLAGAYPLMHVITKVFRKPLLKMGGILGINEVAAAGMVASLANSIPMFGTIKDMDRRGKVVNMAFAVSAAFVFGDHLGFTAGFNSDMIFPVIVGKLVGGMTAVAVAIFITRNWKEL